MTEIETIIEPAIVGNTTLSKRFGQDDWLAAEKPMGKFEKTVVECLMNLGKNQEFTSKQELVAMGETLYLENRHLLETNGHFLKFSIPLVQRLAPTTSVVPEDDSGKKTKVKKQAPPKKADLIRLEQSKKRAEEVIKFALNSFDMKDFQPNHAFNSNILEIKGIGLMYSGYYLSQYRTKYNKKKYLPFVFGIMVAIQRYLNNCSNIDGKNMMNTNERIPMSTTICADLQVWLNRLTAMYPYNGFAIYDYAPELLTYTEYDKAIPSTGIRPRGHQIELVNCVRDNFNTGFFGIYNPMLASGKTSGVASLGAFVAQLRESNPEKYGKVVCIFACNAIPVRNQAANICYNGNIKFAIAGRDLKTGGYRITNHNLCKYENDRHVIITSPEIASEILSDPTNDYLADNCILYLDEPTMGADKRDSDSLRNNMNLITELVNCKNVIFSSATFPDPRLIPTITEYFMDQHPAAKIVTIYSDEIQIGCDLETYSGQLVVPHLGVKTKEELTYVIDVIRQCPFLGRVYTPHVVKTLYVTMSRLNVSNVPNIAVLFSNVDNMSSNKVRKIAMSMLDILAKEDDSIIESVCSSSIMTEKENIALEDDEPTKVEPEEDAPIVWVKQDDETDKYDNGTDPVDFYKLVTTQAWRMQNPTVIASKNPVEFVREHFENLRNDIYSYKISSGVDRTEVKEDVASPELVNPNNADEQLVASTYKTTRNIIEKYNRDLEIFQKQIRIMEKNATTDMSSARTSNTTSYGHQVSENTSKRNAKLSQKMETVDEHAPKLKFPDFGHINTLHHIKKYAKCHASKIVGRYVRSPIVLEDLPFDEMNVPDDILTLLFAGVGICVTNHPEIDEVYSRVVLELASEGKLAFIVVDESFAHGTNYPINRVIFTDKYADDHDIFNIMQMLGRAGRVGRSWVAKGIVSDKLARRIIAFTRNMEEANIQAKNMTDCFSEIMKTKEVKQRQKLQALLLKYTAPTAQAQIPVPTGGIGIIKNNKNVPAVPMPVPTPVPMPAPAPASVPTPAPTQPAVPRIAKISEFVEDYVPTKKEPVESQSWRRVVRPEATAGTMQNTTQTMQPAREPVCEEQSQSWRQAPKQEQPQQAKKVEEKKQYIPPHLRQKTVQPATKPGEQMSWRKP